MRGAVIRYDPEMKFRKVKAGKMLKGYAIGSEPPVGPPEEFGAGTEVHLLPLPGGEVGFMVSRPMDCKTYMPAFATDLDEILDPPNEV